MMSVITSIISFFFLNSKCSDYHLCLIMYIPGVFVPIYVMYTE